MTFYEALHKVQYGSLIRREGWIDPEVSCELVDGVLSINTVEGTQDGWIISIDDMVADDWVSVGEEAEEDLSIN